jgi:hypothetical protein
MGLLWTLHLLKKTSIWRKHQLSVRASCRSHVVQHSTAQHSTAQHSTLPRCHVTAQQPCEPQWYGAGKCTASAEMQRNLPLVARHGYQVPDTPAARVSVNTASSTKARAAFVHKGCCGGRATPGLSKYSVRTVLLTHRLGLYSRGLCSWCGFMPMAECAYCEIKSGERCGVRPRLAALSCASCPHLKPRLCRLESRVSHGVGHHARHGRGQRVHLHNT